MPRVHAALGSQLAHPGANRVLVSFIELSDLFRYEAQPVPWMRSYLWVRFLIIQSLEI